MTTSLRPYRASDHDFLFQLYCGTRMHEVAAFGWPEAQQQAFLRMQFTAQQRWYETMYSGADHQIIEQNGVAIGRILVWRRPNAVLLVDIALLPEFRGRGIGGDQIGKLIEQCKAQGLALRLQVQKGNPARKLYERLGFTRTGEDQMYLQMEKVPG